MKKNKLVKKVYLVEFFFIHMIILIQCSTALFPRITCSEQRYKKVLKGGEYVQKIEKVILKIHTLRACFFCLPLFFIILFCVYFLLCFQYCIYFIFKSFSLFGCYAAVSNAF